MTALLSPNAKQQFFTDGSTVAAGYRLHTYAANTTTPQATFTNRAGTVANTNPIILDARGEATIYLTPGVVYDYVLETPLGSPVWTREDVAAQAGEADAVFFTQAGTGAVERTMQAKGRERYTALDVIPVSEHAAIAAQTSTLDVSTYIEQAVANNDDVILPPGRYYVTDQIDVPSGKRLRGAGKHKTVLYVPATFNLAADGVIKLAAQEPGGIVEDLSVIFVQPDTNVRANLTQYPPAIYAQGCPRFAVRRVRIELAWDGIDMKGNSGGAVLDDVEMACFNIDIDIDGSLDSVKISKLHIWPFGLTARPLLYSLYESALHTGIKSGRCDDFHLSDSILYSLPTATNFYQSASGSTFGNINNVDFDDRGGLNVSAGALSLTACYFTLGKTDAVLGNISGGSVSFAGCNASITVLPNGGTALIVSGADTQVTVAGGLWGAGAVDCSFIAGSTGCTINVVGVGTNRATNTAYTRATFNYGNARGVCVGNTANAKGTGAGVFVAVGTDTKVHVADNQADGWSYSFPAGAMANAKLSLIGVLGSGSATPTPNGSGIATIAHGLPARPRHVVPVVRGSGGFVHVQFVSVDDTNITVEFRDAAGGVITTAVGVDWVAFL